MKHLTLLILSLFFFFPDIFGQQMNAKIKDPNLNNQEVLIGYCNLKGLTAGEFGIYFESQYDIYKPSEKSIEKLKDNLHQVDITIIFGSWCSDSKLQVPRFYKVLDEAGYNTKSMKVIGVNREKNALSVNIMNLGIELVPTFIVYYEGNEVGRIVETPKKSLEKDLAKIIKKAK